MVLLVSLYILVQVSGISAASLYEGKEFLIATPAIKQRYDKVNNFPRLVLTFISGYTGPITVISEGLTGRSDFVEQRITLTPLTGYEFFIDNLYFGLKDTYGPRWAYRITGQIAFSVMVSMETDINIVETFTAVPISAWGSHYAVVTLNNQFSVVLLANEYGNTITFKFRFHDPSFKLNIAGVDHEDGSEMNIELNRYQAYAISYCAVHGTGSLTGSFIQGVRPFGVVSGNCNGTTEIQRCYSVYGTSLLNATSGSPVAEMLLPIETAGCYFILFCLSGRYGSPGYFLFLALQDSITSITLSFQEKNEQGEDSKLIILHNKGSWHTEKGEFIAAKSTKPIQLMYIQNSSCYFYSEGDPSMLIVTPLELFYFIYYIMTPNSNARHYFTVAINVEAMDSLKMIYPKEDDRYLGMATLKFNYMSWSRLLGNYTVIDYEIRRQAKFTVYSLKARFGCYVYGVAPYSTYMHNAGFISSNINQAYCQRSEAQMIKGDLLDNDCDGWVDEEKANGINDDIFKAEDKTIDEDLGFYFNDNDTIQSVLTNLPSNMIERDLPISIDNYRTPGYIYTTAPTVETVTEPEIDIIPIGFQIDFSEWTEWQCSNSCEDVNLKRTRTCLRLSSKEKCAGSTIEIKNADCYSESCPPNCEEKTFGDNCTFKCPNCDGDCDKFNGSCLACRPGFEYPETGCTININKYQAWTDWKCSEECEKPYLIRERKRLPSDLCKDDQSNCVKNLKELAPGDCRTEKICPKYCKDFTWGPECNNTCENCHMPCNKFTGECNYCRGGFMDEKKGCITPCGRYQYGPGCMYNCSDLCGGHDCVEREHGTCPITPHCKDFTWGPECNNTCKNCDMPCNKFTGECNYCRGGFMGEKKGCITPCGEYQYGSGCMYNCSVLCGGHDCIEREHGTCPITPYCKDFTWGPECNNTCENCEKFCNKFTGVCNYCRGGFMDEKKGCLTPCGEYQYGPGCMYNCSVLCGGHDCIEREHGTCPVLPHCEDFTWGLECNNTCENCEKPCNMFTGECNNCRGGFMDEKKGCVTPCGEYQYGPGCMYKCSDLCGEGHDCIEREHGTCPFISQFQKTNYILIAAVLIGIVAAASALYFVLKCKKIEVAKSTISLHSFKSKSKESLKSQRSSKLSTKGSRLEDSAKDKGGFVNSIVLQVEPEGAVITRKSSTEL